MEVLIGFVLFYFVVTCLPCPWNDFTSCPGVLLSVIVCRVPDYFLLCPITCTLPVYLNQVCPLSGW